MTTFQLAGVDVPRIGLGTNRLRTNPEDVRFVREAVGEGRPDALRAQIEQSLRSLRTEAIGLYYLHRVDPETPLEESLGAIKEYVDSGRIRHVGLCEVGIEQVDRARQVVP